jgi:hypothetical protein
MQVRVLILGLLMRALQAYSQRRKGGWDVQEMSSRYGHLAKPKPECWISSKNINIPFEDKNIDFFTFVDERFDADALPPQLTSHHWADRLVDGMLRRE